MGIGMCGMVVGLAEGNIGIAPDSQCSALLPLTTICYTSMLYDQVNRYLLADESLTKEERPSNVLYVAVIFELIKFD